MIDYGSSSGSLSQRGYALKAKFSLDNSSDCVYSKKAKHWMNARSCESVAGYEFLSPSSQSFDSKASDDVAFHNLGLGPCNSSLRDVMGRSICGFN